VRAAGGGRRRGQGGVGPSPARSDLRSVDRLGPREVRRRATGLRMLGPGVRALPRGLHLSVVQNRLPDSTLDAKRRCAGLRAGHAAAVAQPRAASTSVRALRIVGRAPLSLRRPPGSATPIRGRSRPRTEAGRWCC